MNALVILFSLFIALINIAIGMGWWSMSLHIQADAIAPRRPLTEEQRAEKVRRLGTYFAVFAVVVFAVAVIVLAYLLPPVTQNILSGH